MVFAIEGVAYSAHWNNYYEVPVLADRIEHIKGMNAEWITLGTPFYTTDRYSHDFHASQRTTSDADLEKAIEQAQAAGLKVFFKPLLKMDNWDPPIAATDVDAWFAGYTDFIVRYAKIAQKTGAEMFALGNELSGVLTGNDHHWKALVEAVDAVYDGILTYAGHWVHLHRSESVWKQEGIDVIGVTNWWPVAPEGEKNPTIAEMQASWYSTDHYQPFMKGQYGTETPMEVMSGLAVKYQKPIMHAEAGYPSRDGGAWRPASVTSGSKANTVSDEQEQADAYTAYFSEFAKVALPPDWLDRPITKDSFFLGSMLWRVEKGGTADLGGHTYEGKIVEDFIRQQFSTDAPGSGGGGGTSGGGTGGGTEGDTVLVEARGTQAGGEFAKLQVLVNGDVYGTVTTTGTKKIYTFTVPELDNASSLEIRFPNDAADKNGNDRNLIVTKVIADGQTLNISDATYERDGKSDIGGQTGLYWNGELNFDFAGGNTDIVTIEARGTQAGGQFAKMEVLVDGVTYGIVTTTATKTTYAFTVPELDNASSLEIRFPNDGMDNAGNDRNLFISKVVADGQTLTINDATYERDGKSDIGGQTGLYWNGELNFDLGDVLI